MRDYVEFSTLTGKTITAIDKDDDYIIFTTDENEKYKMFHEQDCCESVYIEDICGELDDLLNSPVLLAEEVSSDDEPAKGDDAEYGSYTWTFYKISTAKGSVTIRWYGTSNGYYSESVQFEQI